MYVAANMLMYTKRGTQLLVYHQMSSCAWGGKGERPDYRLWDEGNRQL